MSVEGVLLRWMRKLELWKLGFGWDTATYTSGFGCNCLGTVLGPSDVSKRGDFQLPVQGVFDQPGRWLASRRPLAISNVLVYLRLQTNWRPVTMLAGY
ncbi:hypothetical protein VTK56DRAFT_9490 [Thermocarpiscus australiensis]